MAGRGNPKGVGRPRGAPNKITRALKDMVLAALDDAGGQAYLAEQARKNPAAFLALLGKILPTQVTGKDDGPIEIRGGIDAPPRPETPEEWVERRKRELAGVIAAATVAGSA